MYRDATGRVCIVFLTLVAGGCAQTQAQVGLSNAPSINRPRIETAGESRDVIANGLDSCGRPGTKRDDPMPYRVISCEDEPEAEPGKPAKKPTQTPKTKSETR